MKFSKRHWKILLQINYKTSIKSIESRTKNTQPYMALMPPASPVHPPLPGVAPASIAVGVKGIEFLSRVPQGCMPT